MLRTEVPLPHNTMSKGGAHTLLVGASAWLAFKFRSQGPA
jgi:hypothetical protein